MYVVSLNVRGWNNTTPYNVVKNNDGTAFYLVGNVGTVTSITVEYFIIDYSLASEYQN